MLTVWFTEQATLSCEEKRKFPLRKEQEILLALLPPVTSSAIAPAVAAPVAIAVLPVGVKSALLALLFFRRGWIVVNQRIIMPGNDRDVLADELLDIA